MSYVNEHTNTNETRTQSFEILIAKARPEETSLRAVTDINKINPSIVIDEKRAAQCGSVCPKQDRVDSIKSEVKTISAIVGSSLSAAASTSVSLQSLRERTDGALAAASIFSRAAHGGCESSTSSKLPKLPSLRALVSANRKRLRENGYDLDMSYITQRVLAMSVPASSGFKTTFRNRSADVKQYLTDTHGCF